MIFFFGALSRHESSFPLGPSASSTEKKKKQQQHLADERERERKSEKACVFFEFFSPCAPFSLQFYLSPPYPQYHHHHLDRENESEHCLLTITRNKKKDIERTTTTHNTFERNTHKRRGFEIKKQSPFL